MKAINKLKDNNLILALIVNIALCVFFFLVFEPTSKSDDYDMMNVLYGGYNGMYSPFLLYSNPIYGYLLCLLLRIIPSVPWFFVVQYLFMFWAMVELATIILGQTKISLWLTVPLLAFVYYECFIRITFTKTAGLMIIGGYLLLFSLIVSGERFSLRIIEGVLLILFGSMIRARLFLMISVIFAGGLLVYLICNRKKTAKYLVKKVITCGIVAGVMLLMTMGLGMLGNALYNHNEIWKDYISTNETRAALYDYGIPDYTTFQKDYEELGISYVDYQTWFSANTRDDPDLLSVDMLAKIRSIANHQQNTKLLGQIKRAVKNVVIWCKDNTMFYLFALCCVLVALTRKRASLYIIPIILGTCLFDYLYLYVMGRTQHHVDAIVFIAGSFLALFFCEFNRPYNTFISFLATCLIGCCFIGVFYNELKSSSYYGTQIVNVASQKEQYSETKEQLDLLSEDSSHLYLFNVNDTNTIYSAFTVWEVIPKNYYHNLHRLNMDHIPIHKNTLQDYGVMNPLKEITNSDIIFYYVSFDRNEEADIILDYIRENYNHDSKKLEVKRTTQGIVYRFCTDDFRVNDTNVNDASDLQYDYHFLMDEESKTAEIRGYVYEKGVDSFAQNVYLKVKNIRDGTIQYFPTKQSINDELESKDKYHGKYSGFVQDFPVSNSGFSDLEITIVLENSNGVYEISKLQY